MNSPAKNPFEELAGANQALIQDFLARLRASGNFDFSAFAKQFALGSAHQREKWLELEEGFYREHRLLWSRIVEGTQIAEDEDAGDHRFDAPEWRELPFFRYLR